MMVSAFTGHAGMPRRFSSHLEPERLPAERNARAERLPAERNASAERLPAERTPAPSGPAERNASAERLPPGERAQRLVGRGGRRFTVPAPVRWTFFWEESPRLGRMAGSAVASYRLDVSTY